MALHDEYTRPLNGFNMVKIYPWNRIGQLRVMVLNDIMQTYNN